MSEVLISIIVPVYKVENYLHRCVKSLIEQTYKNIEIILIDDGSPDKCPELCDLYAKKDKRIKVIHKINGGLSDARNLGLEVAQGEYILFLDSDDYVEVNTCEKFISIIKKENKSIDIVVGNFYRIEQSKSKLIKNNSMYLNQIISGEEYLKSQFQFGKMHMEVWLNLYNKKFLLDNNLKFVKGLLHEDEDFTPRVFLKAKKVIPTDIIFYFYMIRKDSITTTTNKIKNAEHIIKTCYRLNKIYSLIEDEELKKILNDDLTTKYFYAIQIGKIYGKKLENLIDIKFLEKNINSKKNKYKLRILKIDKRFYCKLFEIKNKILKIKFLGN